MNSRLFNLRAALRAGGIMRSWVARCGPWAHLVKCAVADQDVPSMAQHETSVLSTTIYYEQQAIQVALSGIPK